jgi:hypothetical protein
MTLSEKLISIFPDRFTDSTESQNQNRCIADSPESQKYCPHPSSSQVKLPQKIKLTCRKHYTFQPQKTVSNYWLHEIFV